jgi:hypothetical protein
MGQEAPALFRDGLVCVENSSHLPLDLKWAMRGERQANDGLT